MANAAAICTSFKVDLFNGLHAFGTSVVRAGTSADAFKCALYQTTGSIGVGTTAYTASNEVATAGGYSAGGASVTNATAPTSSGTTAYWTPSASITWTGVNFTTDCCLIYNNTLAGKNAVASFALGAIGTGQTVSGGGNFTLTMPTNAVGTALLQIA